MPSAVLVVSLFGAAGNIWLFVINHEAHDELSTYATYVISQSPAILTDDRNGIIPFNLGTDRIALDCLSLWTMFHYMTPRRRKDRNPAVGPRIVDRKIKGF
ncbi:hypothetical protein BDZ45DRAFT_721965 [Acephala macrosclerotiorum]|nr:hypothetical protein BDZ45DRAFT_721965 [Acephala macrosclerotiorum]